MSPVVALLFAACTALAAASAAGLSSAQLARQHALEASWDQELEADGVSPVKRVVGLLKKMKAELEAETAKESEMYDKMVCWCETNEKEKTAAIAAAEAKDKDLSAEIEGRAASFGEFSAEIERLKKEVAENTQALKEATAIREKEASEFRAHEVDLVQTVTNLRNAIAVLSKHQTSLLQVEGTELVGLRVVLRSLTLKYEELLAGREERQHSGGRPGAVSGLQVSKQGFQGDTLAALHAWGGEHAGEVLPIEIAERMLAKAARGPQRSADKTAFLQAGDRQPIYQSRSASRSSEIFGILNQMLDEFNKELTTSQAAELKSSEDYAALAAAKQEQIDAGKKKLDELEAEHAANEKALSDAKEDLANTRAQREADVEFLRNLKLQCNDLDSQWEKRSKTRAAELVAVSDTIAILTEDDNRELLSKSVTLLQVAAASSKRAKTMALLRDMARSPDFEANDLLEAWRGRGAGGVAPGPRAQLSTLAMAVKLDGFEKVKEMMDKMVTDLKAQMTEEVALKDHCTKEFDTNNKTMYEKTELKKDLEIKIAQLAALVERLNGEIAAAKAQIAATQEEVKKASQIREQENGQFQSVVTDQRATQTILTKALQRLKDFYQKGLGKAVLAQRGAQEPPVKFNSYKDNAGSKSVIGLIEQIIEDSKKLEADATAAEAAAQADYETFVRDSNGLIKNLEDGITANSKAIAAAKEDDAQANSDLTSTVGELESLTAYEADLPSQCDFVLRNFDIRQKARLQEIEAIQAAKAILSGAQ